MILFVFLNDVTYAQQVSIYLGKNMEYFEMLLCIKATFFLYYYYYILGYHLLQWWQRYILSRHYSTFFYFDGLFNTFCWFYVTLQLHANYFSLEY